MVAFGRHQNLDRQEIPKLLVPRLVLSVGCAVDPHGTFYLDNVDVGGVAAAAGVSPYFLAGFLNGKVVDFVFHRISKPFRGRLSLRKPAVYRGLANPLLGS